MVGIVGYFSSWSVNLVINIVQARLQSHPISSTFNFYLMVLVKKISKSSCPIFWE